jgi:hypothetical protein
MTRIERARLTKYGLGFLPDGWLETQGIENIDEMLSAMRTEQDVTQPETLRAIKSTRISFARTLFARLMANKWKIQLTSTDIAQDGSGTLIYDIEAEGIHMHFGVLSCASIGVDRSGRLSDKEFDFYALLREGRSKDSPIKEGLVHFREHLWSARADNKTIGFTVANRSVATFSQTLTALAKGIQPDPDILNANGGYLLRNSGWYANGRHGTRSWKSMAGHPLEMPYHPDMFALYLWRMVGFDVVEHAARAQNPKATLTRGTKQALGVGNSSGMGMVAALVRWPEWFGAFNTLREMCLAHGVTRKNINVEQKTRLVMLLRRSADYYAVQPGSTISKIALPKTIAEGLHLVANAADQLPLNGSGSPLLTISKFARKFDREVYEQTNAIIIELFPDFATEASKLFARAMMRKSINPRMTLAEILALIDQRYDWATSIDLTAPGEREYFWYRSEESGETRRGERSIDNGVENETFVDVVGDIQRLRAFLELQDKSTSIGRFLLQAPEYSALVRRIQLAENSRYTEIRGNIIGRDFRPCDCIRFLLSTFGLEASWPSSERFVRGVFFQGAPLPEEIDAGIARDWLFPELQFKSEAA